MWEIIIDSIKHPPIIIVMCFTIWVEVIIWAIILHIRDRKIDKLILKINNRKARMEEMTE
jgi:hypothetical protein